MNTPMRRSYSRTNAVPAAKTPIKAAPSGTAVAPVVQRQNLVSIVDRSNNRRTASQQVHTTASLRSAATTKHSGTILPNAPLASGKTTPIVLRGWGSVRGTSTSTVVIPPPQPLIPNIMRKLIGR